jgi:hypothetical protein
MLCVVDFNMCIICDSTVVKSDLAVYFEFDLIIICSASNQTECKACKVTMRVYINVLFSR